MAACDDRSLHSGLRSKKIDVLLIEKRIFSKNRRKTRVLPIFDQGIGDLFDPNLMRRLGEEMISFTDGAFGYKRKKQLI